MSVFANLLSWSFVVGVVAGFALSRIWCVLKLFRLDRTDPLPNGRRRPKLEALAIDRRYLAGAVAVAFLSWSVLQTEANAEENARIAAGARDFAAAVQKCNAELIAAITGSRQITADNDRLSKEERALLADGQRASREWVGALLQPPADVAALPEGSAERIRYEIETTRNYFARIGRIQARIDAVHDEQNRNERERPALPDPQCGT